MSKRGLVICDLDGTLYDTNGVNYAAYAEAMQESGYSLDYEYYCQECNGRSYRNFFGPLGIRHEDYEVIHQRKKMLYASYLGRARENSSLFSILEALQTDFYLAIVTTASAQNCQEILRAFGRHDLFQLVLTAEDVTRVKPDPEGFLKAMAFFSMDADSTMIFEDSADGLAAAKAAGTTVFAASRF